MYKYLNGKNTVKLIAEKKRKKAAQKLLRQPRHG